MVELICEPLQLYISGIERNINCNRLSQFEVFSEFFMPDELNNTIGYVVLLMILGNNTLSFKVNSVGKVVPITDMIYGKNLFSESQLFSLKSRI